MAHFRIRSLLIFTAIVAMLLLGALSPVSYSYGPGRQILHVTRPPTTKEVAQRMAVTVPAMPGWKVQMYE